MHEDDNGILLHKLMLLDTLYHSSEQIQNLNPGLYNWFKFGQVPFPCLSQRGHKEVHGHYIIEKLGDDFY